MNFETIDWNAEAPRIARAFGVQWLNGVEFPCRFVEKVKAASPFHPEVPPPHYRELTWENDVPFIALLKMRPKDPIAHFRCEYNQKKGMTFAVDMLSLTSGKATHLTDVTIDWRGYVKSRIRIRDNAYFLAKGLHNLGLLTPEVEAALDVCLTAKDKAEWSNEFVGYVACETMDWAAEAERIAYAFDLKGEVGFQTRVRDNQTQGHLISNDEPPKKLRVGVGYSCHGKSFWVGAAAPNTPQPLDYWNAQRLASVHIDWDGSIDTPANCENETLLEGLFNLGLLTPENIAALKLDILNHQKNKWARAYAKRRNRKKR